MHLIRRSVLRTSSLSKPRSIATRTSPFQLRRAGLFNPQAAYPSPVFRRNSSSEELETASRLGDGPLSTESVDPSRTTSTISSANVSAYSPAEDGDAQTIDNSGNQGGADARRIRYAGHRENDANRPSRSMNDTRFRAKGMPSNSIYVGNLSFDATEDELDQRFGAFGTVLDSRISKDSLGRSKGFAFIEFETKEMAEAAVNEMNGTAFRGRTVVVDFRNVRTRVDTPRSPLTPSKTVFIGNLAYEITDADLNEMFKDDPNVVEVRVAVDRRTGQPRGFAHADFRDVESAIRGKEFLTGRVIHGRRLRVDFAGKRENNLPRDMDAASEGGGRY